MTKKKANYIVSEEKRILSRLEDIQDGKYESARTDSKKRNVGMHMPGGLLYGRESDVVGEIPQRRMARWMRWIHRRTNRWQSAGRIGVPRRIIWERMVLPPARRVTLVSKEAYMREDKHPETDEASTQSDNKAVSGTP